MRMVESCRQLTCCSVFASVPYLLPREKSVSALWTMCVPQSWGATHGGGVPRVGAADGAGAGVLVGSGTSAMLVNGTSGFVEAGLSAMSAAITAATTARPIASATSTRVEWSEGVRLGSVARGISLCSVRSQASLGVFLL